MLLLSSMAFAQNANDILIKVGNETITKSQFVTAYQKNNLLSESTEKDLREYLDLYINYRMKVQEAIKLQMDTSTAFKKNLPPTKDSLRNNTSSTPRSASSCWKRLLTAPNTKLELHTF